MIDLKINNQLRNIFSNQAKETKTKKTKMNDFERLSYMMKASEIFVRELRKVVEGKKVVLVFDGDRENIYKGYKGRNLDKNFNLAFRYLRELVLHLENFLIVDLQETFSDDWSKNRNKFNYEYDFHWNKYGHNVVARAIIKALENH